METQQKMKVRLLEEMLLGTYAMCNRQIRRLHEKKSCMVAS
jgi:hypothetical protein